MFRAGHLAIAEHPDNCLFNPHIPQTVHSTHRGDQSLLADQGLRGKPGSALKLAAFLQSLGAQPEPSFLDAPFWSETLMDPERRLFV